MESREILPHLGTSPRSQIPRTDNCSRFVTGSIRAGEKKKKFDEQRSLETDKFSKFRDSGEAGEIVYLN